DDSQAWPARHLSAGNGSADARHGHAGNDYAYAETGCTVNVSNVRQPNHKMKPNFRIHGSLKWVIAFAAIALFGMSRIGFGGPVEADLLIAYGAAYASSLGGTDNLEVTVQNAVTGNNAINDRSGTGARMRVCAFYQSAQDATNGTTTGGLVGWLANNDSRVSDVVSYAATIGADLVTYYCQNTDYT